MRKFEETLKRNIPYMGKITDYSKVSYNVDGKEIIFNTMQLKNDLRITGYDDIQISLILEAIHHSDGAMHDFLKLESIKG